MRQHHVYILASKRNGTLYVGATSDLIQRIYAHRNGMIAGFTKTHKVHDLVYYEEGPNFTTVFAREKQIKHWKRAWKIELIESKNPQWVDLYDTLL